MAGPKLGKDDAALLRTLKKAAKSHIAGGLSASAALTRTIDDELASVDDQIAEVRKQATPEVPKSTKRRDQFMETLRQAKAEANAATAKVTQLTEMLKDEDLLDAAEEAR